MIALKINGRYVELSPSTRLSYKLNNPLFDEDGLIKGSYTFPFDLAGAEASELNAVLMGHPDVIENAEGYIKQDADIFFDDVFFKRGKLTAKNAGSKKSSCHFIFGMSTLSDEIKTKKIRDLISETIVIDNTAITKKIYLVPGTLAADPYMILVNGRAYSASSLTGLRDAINNDTTEPRASCTHQASGTTPLGVAAPYLEITPYANPNDPLTPISVAPAEDNGNASTGFKWYCEAFDMTTYYQGFVDALEGYFDGTYPTNKIRFPFRINYDMYGEGVSSALNINTTKEQPYVNGVWNYETIITNKANSGASGNRPFTVRNLNSLQPFVRVQYVLDKIAEYFNFSYEGDWYGDTDTAAMLFDNAAPLDDPQDFIGTRKFVFWKRSFNPANLVPDWTVADFFKHLRDRYNVGIYKNEITGNVVMRKREPLIKSTTHEDMTAVATPLENIDNQRMTGIRLKAEKTELDKSAVDDVHEVGDPEDELVTKISGLGAELTITNLMGVVCNVQVPVVTQPITDKFTGRIFYYKGITTSDGPVFDFDYPRASINAINYDEKFTGATGIYEKLYKRWIAAVLNRRVVAQSWTIPYRKILDLDWEIKRRFDRNDYLIKSLEFTMQSNRMTAVRVELYTTS